MMNIFLEEHFEKYYKANPITLLDIGASGGLRKVWKKAGKFLQIIAFEPDQRAVNILKMPNPASRIIDKAVYKDRRSIIFNLTREQKVASIYKPNRQFLDKFPESEMYDILKTVQVDADSLDNIFSIEDARKIDFIKIDTQGSELDILEGGVF